MYGPTLPISEEIHALKYRQEGETFQEAMERISNTLSPGDLRFQDALLNMRFMPAGRVQAAIGSKRKVTPYNCFVSETIEDSMDGIMRAATRSATTMRLGGGIGYDFSTLRPRSDRIRSLDSKSSGPVSFMNIFDAICGTIAAAGHRRGAQMGVLRVDHPDIEEFIEAKQNTTRLTNFNISVAITDEFMLSVGRNTEFDLVFNGKVYKTVNARELWDKIMRSTWDWAEPGVLFIDRINSANNLWSLEEISATNPCAEQPLPPNGACLLGSFNLTKYITTEGWYGKFDWVKFEEDIFHVVRAMDHVIDVAIYPLEQQELEARRKRRMGLGITGAANAIEALGFEYGSKGYLEVQDAILSTLANKSYQASALLAKEEGPFPYWQLQVFQMSHMWPRLNDKTKELITAHGLRNSHLTSIAPTGTISLAADNISSGIEPVFSYGYERTIQTPEGPRVEEVTDYGVRVFNVRGKTADKCSVDDHLNVLIRAQYWVDSAVSKTCNIGDDVTFDEFKGVYMKAWKGGAKGCTTFRAAGKRLGILVAKSEETEGAACYIDPETGKKSCE